jgi:hypothetical protein
MQHGRGISTLSWGDLYDGEYINNKKHGGGVYRWEDGRTYTGVAKHAHRLPCKFAAR